MLKVNLKSILKQKNMSLTDLSKATGISLNAISAFANGKSTAIQFSTLEKIMVALNVDMGELIKHVEAIVSLRLIPVEVPTIIEENEEKQLRYELEATDLETKEIYNLSLKLHVKTTSNTVRRIHMISYNELDVDIDKNFVGMNIYYGNSTLLKSLDFLVVHDLNNNNRLQDITFNDLYLFDYGVISNVHQSESNRITRLGNDTNELLLDFIEYISDPGIEEIVLDDNEKFECLNIFL